jgi:hypothetical protein
MEFEDVRPFLPQRHHRGVITTYRPNGAMHASIVVCGRTRARRRLSLSAAPR